MYEETDIGLHLRPFTEGMIVVYAYNNRKYVGKVLQAGFNLLLVEECFSIIPIIPPFSMYGKQAHNNLHAPVVARSLK